MGYKETDGGSTVSSQGLEGEERSGCQLHLQLAEDGASLIRTHYPGFLSQILSCNFTGENKTWDREPAARLDILLGQLLDTTYWQYAFCITYSATLRAEDSILPWHTG